MGRRRGDGKGRSQCQETRRADRHDERPLLFANGPFRHITLDFVNTDLDPGARAGIELTLESAKELRTALDRAIAAADYEEAELRGKGAPLSLVRAA